jgi:hypothetical protein
LYKEFHKNQNEILSIRIKKYKFNKENPYDEILKKALLESTDFKSLIELSPISQEGSPCIAACNKSFLIEVGIETAIFAGETEGCLLVDLSFYPGLICHAVTISRHVKKLNEIQDVYDK